MEELMIEENIVQNITEKIQNFSSVSDFDTRMKIYFVETNDETNFYKMEAGKETKSRLMEIIVNQYAKPNFISKEVVNYDITITRQGTHQVLPIKQYANIQTIVESLSNDKAINPSISGMDEYDFSHYVVEFKIDDVNYYAFGQFQSVSKISKKMILGSMPNISNTELKVFRSDEIVGFNKYIDMLIYGDILLIHGGLKQTFEKIFHMEQLFTDTAIAIIENNESIAQVFSDETLEFLKTKIENKARITRRLIKIIDSNGRFEDTISNISELDSILKNPDHPHYKKVQDIEYNPNTRKISLKSGSNRVEQLINAISDGFYTSDIARHKGFDETH